MKQTVHLYFNPYTDFGFKKLFGEEANKDLLIDFLNSILPEERQIQELYFKKPERDRENREDRKAIFDIHCKSMAGEWFIVEMQKAKMMYFKERALFYSFIPINEQAPKGDWDYNLEPVYFIAILDFLFDGAKNNTDFKIDVALKDQHGSVFYDKLNYSFIQMPLFNKKENELETHFDKWLFFLKNLENFDHIPAILNEPVFQKGFEIARLGNLSPGEMEEYKQSRKIYLDMMNVIETAREEVRLDMMNVIETAREEVRLDMMNVIETAKVEAEEKGLQEGLQKGLQEGRLETAITIARKMIKRGNPLEEIQELTRVLI